MKFGHTRESRQNLGARYENGRSDRRAALTSTRCAGVTKRQLKIARAAARLLGLSHQRVLQLTQGEAERYEEAKYSVSQLR